MPISFSRPSGAVCDVRELEYISALHQTDTHELRSDGSIRAEDIRLFLMSRYGIVVSSEEVRNKVITGFGGDGQDDDDHCLDLMEIVTVLMIPTLLKASFFDGDLPEGVTRPREGLIDFILNMILHDTTGDRRPKKLTKELIQRILVSYGEASLASQEDLVEEMLEVATTDGCMLHQVSFAKALTDDVQLYDISTEVRYSTNYDDVFMTKNHKEVSETEWDEESSGVSKQILELRRSMSRALKRKWTIPAIDTLAGTYRSKTLMVSLWASFALSYFGSYGTGSIVKIDGPCTSNTTAFEYNSSWREQSAAIQCAAAISVTTWLFVFIIMCIYGLLFVGLASIGNDIECRKPYLPLIGAFFSVSAVFGPSFVLRNGGYLSVVTKVFGSLAAVLHVCHFVAMVVPPSILGRFPLIERFIKNQPVMSEVRSKRAASEKLIQMTKNAIEIAENKDQDAVIETHFGQGLHGYSKLEKRTELVGGFSWTWSRIFSFELFDVHGISFSTRLLSNNMAQFVGAIFVLLFGISLTVSASHEFDKEETKTLVRRHVGTIFNQVISTEDTASTVANFSTIFSEFLVASSGADVLDRCAAENFTSVATKVCTATPTFFQCNENASDYLCELVNQPVTNDYLNLALLDASGLNVDLIMNVTQSALEHAAEQSADSLYPQEQYMITVPVGVSTVAAFITAISLAVTYIPSVTTTTLKLRSGVIPTLRDPSFIRNKIAVDQVTVLTGSMFWGCLLASALVGTIFGLIVFFFVWQSTLLLAQKFVAFVIGIVVVVLVKVFVLMSYRSKHYAGFYRKKPGAANLMALMLECANFALSVGFVLLRMFKLLLTSALYVGRIDTPFLAKGVGQLGGFELDGYPRVFMKDLLATEAHRHPYIETLGVMYLMKLCYGQHFGKRAGSAWRLIFVYALMPWLNVYRINGRSGETVPQSTTRVIQYVSLRHIYHRQYTTDEEGESEEITIRGSVDGRLRESVANLERQRTLVRVEELRQRNQELEKEVELLRSLLNERNNEGKEE